MADEFDALLAPEPDPEFFKAYDNTQTPAAHEPPPGPDASIPNWDVSGLEMVQDAVSKIVTAHRSLNAGANSVLAKTLDAPVRVINMAYRAVGGDPSSPLITEGQMEKLLNTLGVSTTWDNADQLQRVSAQFGEGAATALSFLVPGAAATKAITSAPKAAQIGLLPATTKMEKAQHIARNIVVEPIAAVPAAVAAGEVVGSATAQGVDQVAQEMGIENRLARFGLSTAAAVLTGGASAVAAGARGARASASSSAAEAPPIQAGEVTPSEVFGPKMAAELAQADKADELLTFLHQQGDGVGPRQKEAMVSIYEKELNSIDPGGRIWDEETRSSMRGAFERRVEAGALPAPRAPKSTGSEAKAFLDNSEASRERSNKMTAKKLVTAVDRAMVDKIGGTRDALLKNGGDDAKHAQMYYDLSTGAPSWAESALKGARRDIYGGLGKADRQALDRLILSERFAQIGAYRPSNKGPVSSPDEWKAYRANLKEELGEAKFADLQSRSQAYFERMRVPLEDMREAGLIKQDEFDKLSRFQYSPLEYIDRIDPISNMTIGKRKMSISSSGIRPLTQKQKGMVNTDTEALLANTLTRVYARMSRNKANQELLSLAKRDKKNGVVAIRKPGKDWTRMNVMVDGKPKKFYMKDEFAEEWVTTPAGMDHLAMKLLSAPADAVRLMATGINPEFAMKNLPRDWLYAWIAPNQLFGKTYSSFMPLGFAQLARDLGTVFPDVVRNGQRMKDYIREGGGMSFLTHGARGEVVVTEKNSPWMIARDILGIVNSRSELWTRLAIRERALRAGMTPEEATWTARTQIDFSQGGNVSKFLDRFIPYLNASIQGVRGAVRAAKQDPSGFSWKVTQAMGASAALWAYNRMNHSEGFSQVDQDIQANNFIIMLPGHYVDAEGNKRHNYLKIPVDHAFAPFKSVADAMMAKYWDNKVPSRQILRGMQNGLTIVGDPTEAVPPLLKALMAALNFDLWHADNVWRGDQNIPPHLEYKEFPDRPTPRVAVDLAAAVAERTGIELSPERMTAITQSVFPSNAWTLGLTSLYNKATTGWVQPEGDDTRFLPDEVITNRLPFVRSVLGTTHPLANIMNETNEQISALVGQNAVLNREADRKIARIYSTKGKRQFEEKQAYDAWIRSDQVPPEDKKRLVDRYVKYALVRKVFDRRDTKGLPEIAWWLNVSDLPAKQRASVFAWQIKEASADKRERLKTLAASIPSFWTDDFVRALKLQEKKEGIK